MQTASYIKLFHPSVVPQKDPRLREITLGQLDGMLKTEVKQLYPEKKHSTRSSRFDFSDVGGESRIQVIQRYVAFFDDVVSTLGITRGRCLPNIVVVGHGTALRIFLEHLGIPCQLEQGHYQRIMWEKGAF